ncbi:hypothetical protein DPEC_G00347480 [Dallia pectoralis]|uniref:Uncharacterized protein n=1 Tax=Dallia pectoralis TaxID=75939 RepID=A0ACC2F450_DALPE|nr:hypothetical protein DPEC_G00347480 [Dallia pectoralis]
MYNARTERGTAGVLSYYPRLAGGSSKERPESLTVQNVLTNGSRAGRPSSGPQGGTAVPPIGTFWACSLGEGLSWTQPSPGGGSDGASNHPQNLLGPMAFPDEYRRMESAESLVLSAFTLHRVQGRHVFPEL